MSDLFAIIAGSSITKSNYLEINGYVKELVSTSYGSVVVFINRTKGVVFVQRHIANPEVAYTPPHLINKKAIVSALQKLGCKKVVGFASVGSMKTDLSIGTVMIPDDFMSLEMITFFDNYNGHISPSYNEPLRQEILSLLKTNDITNVRDTGSYYQASGPRFETVSEIKLYSGVCDIVGMTSAHEAILCKEVGIAYANICLVDNMANGIADTRIDLHAFHSGVASNLSQVEVMIDLVARNFAHKHVVDTRIVVDQVLQARWVVPVVAGSEDVILENTSVVVNNKKIVDILSNELVLGKYNPKDLCKLGNRVLIPGLINAHTHAGMSMLRGYSDDLALLDWLHNDIWPAEARYMPSDDIGLAQNWVKTGTELAIVEMVRGGTTCFNDMYFKPDTTASVLKATGFRGCVGFPLFSFYPGQADVNIKEGLEAKVKYADCENITFAIAPHAPYTVNDEDLKKSQVVADKEGILYHIHLHETTAEVTDSIAQKKESPSCHKSDKACSPLDNLHQMDILSKNVIAVHMTCMTEEHIQICKEKDVNIVHCPYSNLKLASGFCPVGKLVEAGVNVSIGTDSTASNNSLDMFAEMKLAACLSKAVKGDPACVPAPMALRMATYNGAKMMKLEDKIGSLEINKEADIVAVKLDEYEHLPMMNVITHLVYSVNRGDVSDVWVQGKQMLKKGEITFLDEVELKSRLKVWEQRIQADKKAKATQK